MRGSCHFRSIRSILKLGIVSTESRNRSSQQSNYFHNFFPISVPAHPIGPVPEFRTLTSHLPFTAHHRGEDQEANVSSVSEFDPENQCQPTVCMLNKFFVDRSQRVSDQRYVRDRLAGAKALKNGSISLGFDAKVQTDIQPVVGLGLDTKLVFL